MVIINCDKIAQQGKINVCSQLPIPIAIAYYHYPKVFTKMFPTISVKKWLKFILIYTFPLKVTMNIFFMKNGFWGQKLKLYCLFPLILIISMLSCFFSKKEKKHNYKSVLDICTCST